MPRVIRDYGTLACFLLLVLLFWAMLPETFMTGRNLFNITQQVSMLAVTAFAMTIVMAMGDYDLSVGSMASLAGVAAAVAFRETGSDGGALLLALLLGLAGGALNGLFVSYLGIMPFVATLGTLTMFSGAAFLLAGGKTFFGSAIPQSFAAFARAFGRVFTAWGVAGLVAPSLAGLLYDWSGNYRAAIFMALGAALAGLMLASSGAAFQARLPPPRR